MVITRVIYGCRLWVFRPSAGAPWFVPGSLLLPKSKPRFRIYWLRYLWMMALNIMQSMVAIRNGILTTIGQPPEIRTNLNLDSEIEDHLNDLESFTDNLTLQRDRFYELYKMLLSTSSDDEHLREQIEAQVKEDANHLMTIDAVVSKYSIAVKRINRKRSYSMSNGNGNGNGSASTETFAGTKPVKLPKLQLATFDGDVLKWSEFWDSFNSSIHQNGTLSEVDKMNYLRGQLSGTAKEAIAGLSATAANYENAIKLLERRFGDKRVIVNTHYSATTNSCLASG